MSTIPFQSSLVIEAKTHVDTVYASIEDIDEPLPVKVKSVEIFAVLRSTEKAIRVENLNKYTAWIPKSVIVSSSRNILHVQSTFQINWIKAVTE